MKKLCIIGMAALLTACGQTTEEKKMSDNPKDESKVVLTVSAAASLKNALAEIEKSYETSHKNIDIKFNYGASGALANQIKSGAPVDIFFSAAQNKVDDLVKSKDIDKKDTTTLLKNHLVLISKEKLNAVEDIQNDEVKKIALGNPEVVPAGEYGKQTLEKLNLYSKVKPKLVLTKDVRQVLTYVETGNTEAGIVYASDLKSTDKIKNTIEIKDDLHDAITYPIAKIKATKHQTETDALYDYLQNDASKKVYEKYGFEPYEK